MKTPACALPGRQEMDHYHPEGNFNWAGNHILHIPLSESYLKLSIWPLLIFLLYRPFIFAIAVQSSNWNCFSVEEYKITTFGTVQLPVCSSQKKVCLQIWTDLLQPVPFSPSVDCSTFCTWVFDFSNAQFHAHFSFHYPELKTCPCTVLPAQSWECHTLLSCRSEKPTIDQKVIPVTSHTQEEPISCSSAPQHLPIQRHSHHQCRWRLQPSQHCFFAAGTD